MSTEAAPADDLVLFELATDLLNRRERDGSAGRELAERLAEGLLSKARYLWDLYGCFDPYEDRAAAIALRAEFERWAQTTEAALQRLEPLARQLGGVSVIEQLGHQYGRTRAMLTITFESLDRAREQIRNGQTYTLEEVKRELRARAGR